MSRSFSVNDSKRLSDEHIKLKSALSAGAQQKKLLREEIKKTQTLPLTKRSLPCLNPFLWKK